MKISTTSRSVETLHIVEYGAPSRGLPRQTLIVTMERRAAEVLKSLVPQKKRTETVDNIKC